VTGGVGHDHQWIGNVVGAIVEHGRTEGNRPLDVMPLLLRGPDEKIEMDLLGNVAARPGRLWQRHHLLDCEFGSASLIVDHNEVRIIVGTLARPVRQLEKLLPERRQRTPILGIEARRDQFRG